MDRPHTNDGLALQLSSQHSNGLSWSSEGDDAAISKTVLLGALRCSSSPSLSVFIDAHKTRIR